MVLGAVTYLSTKRSQRQWKKLIPSSDIVELKNQPLIIYHKTLREKYNLLFKSFVGTYSITCKQDILYLIISQTYPKIPLEWWQENPIEGTLGVRAVTGVEELQDALMALLIVSNTLDFKLLEWKSHLKSLGAGGLVKVTYVHYLLISGMKAWVPENFVTCNLNGKIT